MSTLARVAILVVLGVALWNPAVPFGRAPIDVIALIDDSLSVDRVAQAERWRALMAQVRTLPADSRLTVIRFASDTAVELADVPATTIGSALRHTPPRTRALDRTGTDLERALDDAFARVALERPATVALITDGIQTQGDAETALRALKTAAVSVIALPVSTLHPDGDAWVESLRVQGHGRVGQMVRIVATVAASTALDTRVRLLVDDETLAVRPVHLRPATPESLELEAPVRGAGSHRLRVELETTGDPRPENDVRESFVDVEGPPLVAYVTMDSAPASLETSLRTGGWDVVRLRPSELESGMTHVFPAVIVLDDVAIDDVPTSAWQTLDRLVRYEGTGLLVLGGPHSFGAGGYRHSSLEELLPVVVEGREPRSEAAILFLVDTSGSMEHDRRGRDRLALARRALLETLDVIPEGDLVGVSTFALEPRRILPLAAYRRPVDARALQLPAASGGTLLRPALDHGIDELSRVAPDQRLLVLLTDGFVEGEDLTTTEHRLADAKIQVIALAIGADVELGPLERLVATGAGTLLRVDESASLPSMMRGAVAARRQAAELGTFHPRTVAPLPFSLAADWPTLGGYMVSRARPDATVYVESERRDPLLATSYVGAGRTAVLPAGLGAWAAGWHRWHSWGRFASGLLQWLARPADNSRLYARFRDEPQGLALDADALGDDGEWSAQTTMQVRIVDPSGSTRNLEYAASAPGRFGGIVPAILPGLYRIALRVGDQVRVDTVARAADRELAPGPPSTELHDWHAAGLLDVCAASGLGCALGAAPLPTRVRPWLTLLAAIAYAGVLAYEETRPPAPTLSSWGSERAVAGVRRSP